MAVLYSLTSRSLHNHADDEINGREEFYAIQENFMLPPEKFFALTGASCKCEREKFQILG